MPTASRLSLDATVLCAIACEAAAAAPRYRLTLLDALKGEAVAINNAGEIAGNLWNDQGGGAVVGWFGGRKEVLPDMFASATAISSKGHIAGYSAVAEGDQELAVRPDFL